MPTPPHRSSPARLSTGPVRSPSSSRSNTARQDIDSRNTYSISARIVESDGRLAFTNDTAYEVITHGSPNKVDMLLVLVQPPPKLVEGDDDAGSDWRTWVEVPAPIVWANLIPNEPEPLLRVAYYQSTIEGCARPGNQGAGAGRLRHCRPGYADAASAHRLGDSLPGRGCGARHRRAH